MPCDRRSLYLLYAATFFIFLNFNIAQSITPLYILDVGGTEFFSGLQSTLFYFTAVILRFYFGPLADRKGNKITLFIGGFAFMTAPLLFLFNQSIGYILLVRMYQAIGLAAYFSSASALVSTLVPKERLGAYIGVYRLVTMSTLMLGPTFALNIMKEYGYDWYHALGIIIGFLAMVFLHFVREPERDDFASSSRGVLPTYNMLKLLKDKKITPIYQSIFIVALCFGLIQTFTVIFIAQYIPEINPSIFFTLFGLGSIISNLTAGALSDRKGRAAVVFPSMMIMAVGVALFYFLSVNIWIMYIGSVVAGFGYAGCIVVLITWVIDTVPLASRTTALALQDSAIDVGIGLGSFLFGILIPIMGMPWSYGLSGVLLFLFAFWKRSKMAPAKRKAL